MKKITILFLAAFIGGMQNLTFGQIKSMGFTQPVITPENAPKLYYPKLKLINDTLFVCSNSGIYQKDLKQDTDWQLYGFKDIPIIEFVKNKNEILAISSRAEGEKEGLILLSKDGGKSYEDYTSSFFFKNNNYNYFFRSVQDPNNPNSLLIADLFNGLSLSNDFGKNWMNVNPYGVGFDWVYVGYHPLDSKTLFYSAETDYFNGIIYRTSDLGENWSECIVPGGDNCVHHVDFHPTDPNILIFSGEGIIGKSTDKGETWEITDLFDSGIYFYNILFDKENPSILYASGARSKSNVELKVYRSIDMGKSWHVGYNETLDGECGGVIDMVKYENKLIFYTRDKGLYELELTDTPPVSMEEINATPELNLYLNSSQSKLYIETDAIINCVEIVDMAGRLVEQKKRAGDIKEIDISRISQGVYLVRFYSAINEKITRKVYIAR